MGDGNKVSVRFRTTESVEKAELDTRDYQYLYQDADGFHFMNQENFDQLQVQADIIGDAAPYLQENMIVQLSVFGENAVAIEIPQKVILEIVETEPTTKGQTASSSYKPAILSNGVRTTVPPHIAAGTRIWVMTADGAYIERAKD
jgi:elongation factor P